MTRTFWISALAAACVLSSVLAQESPSPSPATPTSKSYPWHRNVSTEKFFVLEYPTAIIGDAVASTTNSAWLRSWPSAYSGGGDLPAGNGRATLSDSPLNIFYVSLPFNDVAFPDAARLSCPWWRQPKGGLRWFSQCQGKWVEILSANGKSCFATWQGVDAHDANNPDYVFGQGIPKPGLPGIGVSPAIIHYLGLGETGTVDWRFVQMPPKGPWITDKKAVVFSNKRNSKDTATPTRIPRIPPPQN